MFWERYCYLCKINKATPNGIAKSIGASNSSCTSWKSGAIPKGDTLLKISNYFNCSIDYLLGRTDNLKSHEKSASLSLNDNERKLLEGYRELNDEGRKQADIYITEFLLQNARFTQKSDTHNVEEA